MQQRGAEARLAVDLLRELRNGKAVFAKLWPDSREDAGQVGKATVVAVVVVVDGRNRLLKFDQRGDQFSRGL